MQQVSIAGCLYMGDLLFGLFTKQEGLIKQTNNCTKMNYYSRKWNDVPHLKLSKYSITLFDIGPLNYEERDAYSNWYKDLQS